MSFMFGHPLKMPFRFCILVLRLSRTEPTFMCLPTTMKSRIQVYIVVESDHLNGNTCK